MSGEWLLAALAHAVEFARYWQEPDGADHALARPAIRAALMPLAGRVAAAGPGWWTAPCVPQDQWLVAWDGIDAPARVPDDALARWRRDTLDDEERAAERPADVRANWGGHWWSTPALAGLPSTVRPGPAGLVLVEDSIGWDAATCHPVRVEAEPRVREIARAADWVDLVRAHPLDVTRSRRHDWWRTTGVDGRWLIPDWASVAHDHDAVHLTVRAYLEAAGRALPVGEGALPVGEGALPVGEGALPVGDGAHTVIAGWDPDRTWWLTDRLRPSGEPARWVRPDEEWRPA